MEPSGNVILQLDRIPVVPWGCVLLGEAKQRVPICSLLAVSRDARWRRGTGCRAVAQGMALAGHIGSWSRRVRSMSYRSR